MYTAIVFLPLIGAIIAGIIALFGAGARHPGGEPVDDGGHHAAGPQGHAAAAAHHEPHGGHDHHPAAQGSRAAELVTCGLLVVSAILSWVAFFEVGLGEGEVFTVPVLTWVHSGSLA